MQQIFRIILLLIFALYFNNLKAQQNFNDPINPIDEKFYMGIGLGQEFGGIGLKAEYLALQSLGVFIGFGYNLVTPAYNAGLSYKILPGKRITPTIQAMYGYNAALKIKGAVNNVIHERTYYGPSFGAGLDIKSKTRRDKFSLAILVPLRNSDFNNDYDDFKSRGYEFEPGILPVTVSLGVNFTVKDKRRKKSEL